MEKDLIKPLVEAILFIESKPVDIKKLSEYLQIDFATVKEAINELKTNYETYNSGLQITEVAHGYLLSTKFELTEKLKKIYTEKPVSKLSKSTLETLAIIAYKQPITRAEIEEIRGVSDAGNCIKTLMERRLIRIVGRKDSIGHPLLYGTTNEFLLYFGLKDLKSLPTIRELKELEE